MSFISSLFNPAQGAGYQAQGTNIQSSVDPTQTAASYNQTQGGIAQQQAFVNALNTQNGIGAQNNLSGMLSNQAAGQGPNPALAQLQATTGQNVANQGALMASQRGVGANPGLIAREAAQQGAGIQQQAAGQGAVLSAQQQLAAQQQLGQLSGQQVAQQQAGLGQLNTAAQGQQGQLLNAVAQQNASNVAMQSNINSANSGVAQANVSGQAGVLGGLIGGAGLVGAAALGAKGGLVTTYAQGGNVEGPKSFVGQHLYAQSMKQGGQVPGVAQVPGNSLKNDKVPAYLSPGEIVVPRSITQSPDAARQAAQFVAAVLAKQGRGLK